MKDHRRSPIEQSVLTGAVTGAAVVVLLKVFTGMSSIPLLVISLIVFGVISILRLRIVRMTGQRSDRQV